MCRCICKALEIKTMTYQTTIKKEYTFEGKGLHSGKISKMKLKPAAAGTGIRFVRVDIGPDAVVEALATNVSSTARSTTLSQGEASIQTIEHLLSALTGLGVDNVEVEIDNVEAPILDGSAKPYTDAICADGLQILEEPRKFIEIDRVFEWTNPETGAYLRLEPSETTEYNLKIDFNSKVMGVQQAHWNPSVDFATEIAPCRTFCFFHEIEYLLAHNLIKGGDVDNALVIVEHPVPEERIKQLGAMIGRPGIKVKNGYLVDSLHFSNECSRHKMLDLIGDLRLTGGFLKAKVTAFKSGHTINTKVARMVCEALATK